RFSEREPRESGSLTTEVPNEVHPGGRMGRAPRFFLHRVRAAPRIMGASRAVRENLPRVREEQPEISKASRPLSEYADEMGDEILVLTSDNRPVAAIISLKDVDSESWALSASGVFQELIERARAEIEMGK